MMLTQDLAPGVEQHVPLAGGMQVTSCCLSVRIVALHWAPCWFLAPAHASYPACRSPGRPLPDPSPIARVVVTPGRSWVSLGVIGLNAAGKMTLIDVVTGYTKRRRPP